MSASVKITCVDAPSIPKSFTTPKGLMGPHKSALTAIVGSPQVNHQNLGSSAKEVEDAVLLAEGGYNTVWLVTATVHTADASRDASPIYYCLDKLSRLLSFSVTQLGLSSVFPSFGRPALEDQSLARKVQYIMRIPKENSLLPYQVRNEVGFIQYLSKHHPNIPVPKIYAWSDGSSDGGSPPFIAMEYVKGTSLATAWAHFNEIEKEKVARRIAEIFVELAEDRFEGIGGLAPETGELMPTVEGSKIFKGRDLYHSNDYYNIGPYKTTKNYVLSAYDKEIYYYTHTPPEKVDQDLFEDVPLQDFIETLHAERQAILDDPNAFLPEEPFVIGHGDLNGRNILVDGTDIVAVIDWEFAGVWPLSEAVGDSVDVVEYESEDDVEEGAKWHHRICDYVEELAEARGWKDKDMEALRDWGNSCVAKVRMEMFPRQVYPDDEEEEEELDDEYSEN